MAISGIAVTRNAGQLRPDQIKPMLAVARISESAGVECGMAPQAQLGATSEAGTTSLWSSAELIVAADAGLVDLKNRIAASGQTADRSIAETRSMAEVIGRLYLQYGPECLKKLRGSFSLAIWDKRTQAMLLAVDRFAVKPLTYYADESQLVFGSQPRSIFASGRVDKKVNAPAIASFLNFSVVPVPESAFQSLSKLPPGCFLLWKGGSSQVHRYWDLEYTESQKKNEQELAQELLSTMSDAVRVYSEDVPSNRLGCFLSGGTDSSSVLGLLTRHKGKAVNAFSIGFSEERFNELEYARLAAQTFQAHHSIAVLTPEETFADIATIAAAYDEPFGNASVLPTYACLKMARREGVQVMLAGDGGDELFGGNERYRTERIFGLYHDIPESLRRYLIEPLAFGLPAVGPLGKARRYIGHTRTPNPDRYFQWLLLQRFPRENVLGPGIQLMNGHSDLLAIPREHYSQAPASSELNRLLYIDIKMTLGDNDLPKVVRAAELAGVDVRFPLLDHPLADFSGRLATSFKVHGLEKRYLFKKATAGLLPKAILAKKKHGFGLPIGLWLKQHPLWRGLAEDVLLDPRTYQRGYFQRSFVEDLFRMMDADQSTYYGDLLWLFLMAELWHRNHAEGVPA
jgi:asparagine synthase (glutamine-hydrolysing)